MTTAQQLALLTPDTITVPCIRGHVTIGAHTADCEGGDCLGCQPVEAVVGHLCVACYSRTRFWLRRIGEHIVHGWSTLVPSITNAAQSTRVQASRNWRLPWAEDAERALHFAYGQLADMVLGHAATFHAEDTIPGRLWDAKVDDRNVDRIPVRGLTDLDGVQKHVTDVIGWELAWTKQIVTQPPLSVKAWYDELDDLHRRLRGRFPIDPPRPRPAGPLVCPVCGETRLQVVDEGTDMPFVRCGQPASETGPSTGCHQTWGAVEAPEIITEGATA